MAARACDLVFLEPGAELTRGGEEGQLHSPEISESRVLALAKPAEEAARNTLVDPSGQGGKL